MKMIVLSVLIVPVLLFSQEKNNQDSIKFEEYYTEALNNYRSSDYDSAKFNWSKASNYAYSQNKYYDLAKCWSNIGICYKLQAQYDSALFFYSKTQNLSEFIDSTVFLGKVHNNIGNVYLETGAYEKAQEHFLQAIELKEKAGDRKSTGSTLLNLGEIQLRLDNYEEAEKYYQESIKIRKEFKDTFGLSSGYINLAILKKKREQYQEAHSIYDKVLKLCESNFPNSDYIKMGTFQNMGSLYAVQNDFESAYLYYDQAEKIAIEIKSVTDITFCKHEKSLLLAERGFLEKALPLVSEAYQIAKEHRYLEGEELYSETLSEIYRQQGNTSKAYDFLRLHTVLKDSVLNEEKQRIISELEFRYQTKLIQKEKEIVDEKLKTEQADKLLVQSRYKITIWVSALIGIIAVSTIVFLMGIRRKNKQLQKANLTIESKNKELRKEIHDKEHYQKQYFASQGRKMTVANKYSKREEIELGDILFLRKQKGTDSVNIYTKNQSIYTKSKSINDLITQDLKDSFFAKVSKSEIINLHYLAEVNDELITIETRIFDTEKKKNVSKTETFTMFKNGEIRELFFESLESFQIKKS